MSLLSTRGRYAVRIMVYIAMQKPGETVRKADIAANEGISEDYVEQILLRLKQGGLVDSVRGARGGFLLTRHRPDLTVAEVAETVEGTLSVADCKGDLCERSSDCVTRPVWRHASEAVNQVLSSYTIGSLAEKARKRTADGLLSYDI